MGEELEIESMLIGQRLNHAYVMKPPEKPTNQKKKKRRSGELPGCSTCGDVGRVVSPGRALKLRPLSPHLALCISSLWLFLT